MIGGFAVLFNDLVDAIIKGQLSSLGLSLVLVVLIVAVLFRSVMAGLLSGGTLGLAMAFLFGLMGLLHIELNLPTAMLSSIMIGVGVDYTIHFLWRYREERRAGQGETDAVIRTLTTSGRGIIINALSVVVGFSVMFFSSFVPVRYFGFLVVVSIGACLLGAMVLMPALVLLLKPKFLQPRGGVK
jgi:predicted RND superfamily exporter protein